MGFPGGSDCKESTCNEGDLGSIPGFGKIPWRWAWLHTPVFLIGESHGQRSLAGCSPWGREESAATEQQHTRTQCFYSLYKYMRVHGIHWLGEARGSSADVCVPGSFADEMPLPNMTIW